jgi:hypothetical protein
MMNTAPASSAAGRASPVSAPISRAARTRVSAADRLTRIARRRATAGGLRRADREPGPRGLLGVLLVGVDPADVDTHAGHLPAHPGGENCPAGYPAPAEPPAIS